jgi:hypothetical protein
MHKDIGGEFLFLTSQRLRRFVKFFIVQLVERPEAAQPAAQ